MSASLIGRSGSSAFRLSTTPVSMSAHGLVLLFGIGTSSLLKNPRHGERVVIQFSVTNQRRLACGAHL